MWNQRYDTPTYVYGTEPNSFLVSAAHHIPRGRVLSLGEGEGRNAVFLAERGHRVTAIDGSRVGVEKARRFADGRGVGGRITWVVGDLATAPLPEGVDAVVSVFCHLPSALRRTVHRRAQAALADGGVAILELYRPEQLQYQTGGPRDLDLLVTLADLRADFDECDLELGEEKVREVVEGTLHTGQAAVVQAVLGRRSRARS
jgi:SAM-dependent methyltransferase